MNIGEAATATGLPAKTIRYYEDIGLGTPLRAANGYRRYRPSDVQKLGVVARARALGVGVEECRSRPFPRCRRRWSRSSQPAPATGGPTARS